MHLIMKAVENWWASTPNTHTVAIVAELSRLLIVNIA